MIGRSGEVNPLRWSRGSRPGGPSPPPRAGGGGRRRSASGTSCRTPRSIRPGWRGRTEDVEEVPDQRERLALVAGVVVHLPATGLRLGEFDRVAEPFEQPDHRAAGLGKDRVVEAGEEQGDPHRALDFRGASRSWEGRPAHPTRPGDRKARSYPSRPTQGTPRLNPVLIGSPQ